MKVLIIGAGPAGTSAAISLRKSGVRVHLIDKATFPRNAPGETLHPGVEPILDQLGILATVNRENFVRPDGINTCQAGVTTFSPYSETENWQGYQLVRSRFDKIMLEQALNLGATFTDDCHPQTVSLKTDGRINVVTTSHGTFEADYFIDASGSRAWLRKQLGIGSRTFSIPLVSYYGHAHTSRADQYSNPVFIWNEDGWTWIAKIGEALVSWALLKPATGNQPAARLPEMIDDAQPVGVAQGRDVTWRLAESLCNKNYCLVGDSAALLDPASSHGVLRAIMSGMMAAHLLVQESPEQQRQAYYDEWLQTWFNADIERLTAMYTERNVRFLN